VVLAGAEPVLYLERSGRALQVLVEREDPRIEPALKALVEAARAGAIKRIALEKIDGEPVIGSSWESLLAPLGFHGGPRRLTLSA
jgi:ATP-dependent Lhr-like helicase